jgi:hypothetical protein
MSDSIEIDLKEIGYVVMDMIQLSDDRDYWRVLVNTGVNLWHQ